jgi:hypothetical protein
VPSQVEPRDKKNALPLKNRMVEHPITGSVVAEFMPLAHYQSKVMLLLWY